MLMSLRMNRSIFDDFKDKYLVFDNSLFKLDSGLILKNANLEKDETKNKIKGRGGVDINGKITKLFEDNLKHVLKLNYTEIDNFIPYIKNEDKFHIIKKRMQTNASSSQYDNLVFEIQESLIEYFQKFASNIKKDSIRYQINRFNKNTPASKLEFLLDSYLTNEDFRRSENSESKRNFKKVYPKDGPLIHTDFKQNLYDFKVCIPTNVYFYLSITNTIIDKICSNYYYERKRNLKHKKLTFDKYIKVKLY